MDDVQLVLVGVPFGVVVLFILAHADDLCRGCLCQLGVSAAAVAPC